MAATQLGGRASDSATQHGDGSFTSGFVSFETIPEIETSDEQRSTRHSENYVVEGSISRVERRPESVSPSVFPEAEVQFTVACLCLMKETEALASWKQFFSQKGFELTLQTPTSMTNAYSLVRRESFAFALAHVPNPADAGGLVSQIVPVRSVHFPPLVVIVDRKPTPQERENFRLQGVVHIIEGQLAPHDESVIVSIADSASWFRGSADRLSVADVLQMLSADRKSGVISASCPHNRDLNTFPWSNGSQCGGERTTCNGWYGRLYVLDGELIHAETPTASGIAALAQMIELRTGTVRFHDVFMEPANRNLTGSLANNILNAMLLVDEKKRGGPSNKPPPPARPSGAMSARPAQGPPPIPSAPPARSSGGSPPANAAPAAAANGSTSATSNTTNQTANAPTTGNRTMKTLEPLLTLAQGLQAAAKADKGGNVQEVVGPVDGESLCAMAAMCNTPLERVSGLLAMGNLGTWTFTNKKRSLYVIRSNDGIVAVTGEVSKNTDPTVKKLAKAVSERR